jgi:hypothetical protein
MAKVSNTKKLTFHLGGVVIIIKKPLLAIRRLIGQLPSLAISGQTYCQHKNQQFICAWE